MVKEAEAHAEEDKQRRAAIEVKNHADSLVYSTEKALKEHGAKVEAADRTLVEGALADLKAALAAEDTDAIRAKTETLTQASMKLGEAMYKAQSEAGQPGQPEAGPDASVVDAEFEEVDDDRKKSA